MCHRPHSSATSLPELTERLRQKSHKITGPRQSILNILGRHAHPMTCKEIFASLPTGDCNLATVYRALHLLESMGMVKRFDFGDAVARYELMADEHDAHHHHLICTRCSAIIEIEACFPQEWEEQIARDHGFQEVTHKLEFFGICQRCAPRTK